MGWDLCCGLEYVVSGGGGETERVIRRTVQDERFNAVG